MTRRFERKASEVGQARRFVRSTLGLWGLAAHAEALELAVSELVTNAVVHGAGAIQVGLRSDGGQVRLEVSDEGRPEELPRPTDLAGADDREPGGWGLQLVEKVADRWGASVDPRHTRVWVVKGTTTPSARAASTSLPTCGRA